MEWLVIASLALMKIGLVVLLCRCFYLKGTLDGTQEVVVLFTRGLDKWLSVRLAEKTEEGEESGGEGA